jgi:hypothetical protein
MNTALAKFAFLTAADLGLGMLLFLGLVFVLGNVAVGVIFVYILKAFRPVGGKTATPESDDKNEIREGEKQA